MFMFRPAPPWLAGILSAFRIKILANDFKITVHANERMAQRGVELKEVIDAVRNGAFGQAAGQEGFVTGSFLHDSLFVIVGAPREEPGAAPSVVTVFREGEDCAAILVVDKIAEGASLDDLTAGQLLCLMRAAKKALDFKVRQAEC